MKKELCYVVHPATKDQEWSEIFDILIKPAVEKAEFANCVLGLPMGEPGSPIEDIISPLVDADLVVIDVTACNDPTLFYLLGVRHARSNRTILITQNPDCILTDFRPYHSITYNTQGLSAAKDFEKQFVEVLTRIETDPERPDNPVLRYIKRDVEWREMIQAQQKKIEELERKLQTQESKKAERIKFTKIS